MILTMMSWTQLPKCLGLFVCVLVLVVSIPTANANASYNVSTVEGRAALRALALSLTMGNWAPWAARLHNDVSASEQLTYAQQILSALPSLAVMNQTEEVARSRHWIERKLNFGLIKDRVRTARAGNEYLGSLLSLYALTGDQLYLNRSFSVADFLANAQLNDHRTGLLAAEIEPLRLTPVLSTMDIAHMGSMAPEYGYLKGLQGPNVSDRVAPMLQAALDYSREKSGGLLPASINGQGWMSITQQLTLQSGEEDFFTALLGRYRLKAPGDSLEKRIRLLRTFLEVMDAATRHRLLDVSPKGRNLYLRNKAFDKGSGRQVFHEPVMAVEGCVHGGNLLLAGKALKELQMGGSNSFTDWANRSEDYTSLGERLVETCHLAANQTVTKLPPNGFAFTEELEAGNPASSGYAFSSGIARSYFIAYRLTGRQQYRKYAAELLQAIREHTGAKVGPTESWGQRTGYAPVYDVNTVPTRQPGFAISGFIDHFHATLRYLYLTFAEDEEKDFPLDKWVFTVLGYPLPIGGGGNSTAVSPI